MSSQPDSQGSEQAKTSLPPDMKKDIKDRLEYGDSISGWIREACRQRLNAESGGSDTTDN
ncbi:hypothetical protein [Natronoarchaeum rubrum]|uniref:hypothetical protein n=1 Tax=Natronoarchaeum rubrum TaxID=755311 RepID=UPI0021110313|nr:hypothetical protein [Natronoarchaeum rubrum]